MSLGKTRYSNGYPYKFVLSLWSQLCTCRGEWGCYGIPSFSAKHQACVACTHSCSCSVAYCRSCLRPNLWQWLQWGWCWSCHDFQQLQFCLLCVCAHDQTCGNDCNGVGVVMNSTISAVAVLPFVCVLHTGSKTKLAACNVHLSIQLAILSTLTIHNHHT